MNKNFKDLTGFKYGRLKVLSCYMYNYGNVNRSTCDCICDCGNKKTYLTSNIVTGNVKSCGCFRKEIGERSYTHNMSKNKGITYNVWDGMKSRCFNVKNIGYPDYGGRGITVCDRWRSNFLYFIEDMGQRPSKKHSIERINNDGDYEPSNCRWATTKEQSRNTRRTVWINYEGVKLCQKDFIEIIGISSSTFFRYCKIYNTVDLVQTLSEKHNVNYKERFLIYKKSII